MTMSQAETFEWMRQRIAELEGALRTLIDAAGHLGWATGIEIQGGQRTRSFISQHRAKCRYWVEQVESANKQAETVLKGDSRG